jgi:hypothetical protein
LAKAYSTLGWDVVVGASNFFLCTGKFELVHYLWPEEYSKWVPPDEVALLHIISHLDYWLRQSRPIITVNNLYPHGYEGNESFQLLYDAFYARSRAIVHHSKTSHQLVCSNFKSAISKPHFFASECAYHDLRRGTFDRSRARAELGLMDEDFVVLVFGALRFWDEVRLLMKGFSTAKVARKRLILATRYNERKPIGRVKRRLRNWRFGCWLVTQGAIRVNDYIPDEEIERYFEAADVTLVLRIKDLGSGIIGMGMTFGKLILAPDHDAFPEYLGNTENVFYKSGDYSSLAMAIERAAQVDYSRIGGDNLDIAKSWTAEGIAKTCLKAAGFEPYRSEVA